MTENQNYYDDLKAHWGELSWAEKHDCLEKEPTSPDTRYLFLSSCMKEKIRDEQSRRRARERAEEIQAIPKKEFRY